jgi:hypothetical protein
MTDDQMSELVMRTAKEVARETRGQREVVVESLRSDLRQVGEALALLDAKVDRRSDVLEDLGRELTARIDVSVAQLTDRIAQLEAGHAELASRVTRIETLLGKSSQEHTPPCTQIS